MKAMKLKSWDGLELHCTLWDSVENPKAVVQLAHGMSEYGEKYDRFAQYLNGKGYIVFADDHRAHGYTETDEHRGHRDGFLFDDTLKDLIFIHNYLKKEYKLPQIFIGHSYGSFLGQAFYEQQNDAKGVVLLGSAYQPQIQLAFAMLLLLPFQLLFKRWRPAFINKGSDFLFNLKYKDDKGPSQWITRDIEKRKMFIEDSFCGQRMSINFVFSMLKGIFITNKKENRKKIDKNKPLAIFSGDMDPIGGFGKKVTMLYDFYKNFGVKELTFKLYPGARHELVNETNYKEVFSDINKFIVKCLHKQ